MTKTAGRAKMKERGLDGKTVLVTGGAGFIGSNFVRFLLGKYPGIRIVNLDKLTYAGNLDNLADVGCDGGRGPGALPGGHVRRTRPSLQTSGECIRHEFIHGDIRDRELVGPLLERVQGVFHFAAETHVDRSIIDAGEFVLTDVFGTYVLLEALRRAPNVEFFVHVSTDEVYGSRTEGFFKETDAMAPSSPYAASKAGADRLAHAYRVTYGVPIMIVRPSNNYGPFQYPEKFIPLFVTNALEGKTLPLYGKGLNVRDWLFVEDNCRAVELVARRGAPGEAYNIGANDERRNIDVARRIVKQLGKPRDLIKFVPDRLGHDARYAVNIRKIRGLGWAPRVSFEDGLKRTVGWYVENESWWRKIKDRSAEYKAFSEANYKDRK